MGVGMSGLTDCAVLVSLLVFFPFFLHASCRVATKGLAVAVNEASTTALHNTCVALYSAATCASASTVAALLILGVGSVVTTSAARSVSSLFGVIGALEVIRAGCMVLMARRYHSENLSAL